MLQLIRTNPGIIISFALLGGGVVVCALVGFIMARSGASLRPIFWFGGLFVLIVGPQLVGHLYLGLRATRTETPRTAALEQLATPGDVTDPSRSQDRGAAVSQTSLSNANTAAHSLFGPDADAQLILDARPLFGEAFATAELARFASLPNGETVLLARFRGSSAAEKAWVNFLRVSGLNQLDGTGDSQRGYAVTRPVGDRTFVLHFGNMVGVWTGKDDDAIRQRMTAGGFEIPRRAPLAGTSPDTAKTGHTVPVALATAFLVVNLFVVVFYFFKGAAWAGTSRAEPGVTPIAATDLAARLEAVNALDVPFHIERGVVPNEFLATWRYADAKWIDLARVRGLKRISRIRLTLDEARGTVRATDYLADYDWSAGHGGANIEWKAGVGIVFFQVEHRRVLGLQLDEQGRFKPELSYAYTFNVQEMKSPLIEAVTRAGWNWRPTLWQGPAALRWLTE